MGLTKREYTDNVTVITAQNLNDIQDAIIALENSANSGLTEDIKQALLQIASKAVYVDDQGPAYYDDLYNALYPPTNVVSISAVYTQSGTVYDNASLDSLKTDLVVTAFYDDSSSETVPSTDYTLSGTLEVGTSTITVSYASKTTTFTVTVTAAPALSSISAVYTQSGTVYTNDTLDSLKANLVVTATYSDSSTAIIPSADYTLSGTLAEGTQTITVAYGGKTATFTVNCTVKGWLYHFNQSLVSSGSEDFGLTGTEVYAAGRLGTDYAYSHMIPTPGTATSDTQYGLEATSISTFPDFNGDFTISYWFAAQANTGYMHPFYFTIFASDSFPSNVLLSDISASGDWTVTNTTDKNSNKTAGIAVQGTATGQLLFRVSSGSLESSSGPRLVKPGSFDPSAWHHYAITKKGYVYRLFIDGTMVFSATAAYSTVYKAGQLSLIANFIQTSTNKSDLNQIPYGGKMQDFYVAEFCKWETAFDPETITY